MEQMISELYNTTFMLQNLRLSGFGLVRNLLEVPIEGPLKAKAHQLENLVSFSNRMTARFYPG